MKVLIIEDNEDIAKQLAEHLHLAGFVARIETEGESGYFEGAEGGYDMILLDVGLPVMDGFSIVEKWRQQGIKVPVIIMTARSDKMDVIRGLDLGADDYVTKPFDMDEVVARIRSNLKRQSGHSAQVMTSGQVKFDMSSGRVLVNNKTVKLTRIEFLIVQYLFMHQGRPVSVSELAEHTYDDFDNDSGIIARHIANIRKKIGHDVIKTEANRGYYVPENTTT